MKYLIDTHILIWLAISPEKISQNILNIVEDYSNEIYISVINLWEIAIKLAIKKLNLQNLKISDLIYFCNSQNIKIIELPVSAIEEYVNLPKKDNHKDPFDRILISLSIAENYCLLTADSKIAQYKTAGLKYII